VVIARASTERKAQALARFYGTETRPVTVTFSASAKYERYPWCVVDATTATSADGDHRKASPPPAADA